MTRDMKRFTKAMLWTILFAAILTWLFGCGSGWHAPASATQSGWHQTPKTLTATSHYLDWLIGLAIVAMGSGLGLFVFLPAFHRISGLVLAIGGGVLGIALFLRVTLWLVPYFAGVLIVSGLAFLGYEVLYKRKAGTFDRLGDGRGNL